MLSQFLLLKLSTYFQEENENGRRCSESSDSEYDPQYKPIISLPEVVVSTNEEDEVELLKVRAKLYRWDAHGDPAEWKVYDLN